MEDNNVNGNEPLQAIMKELEGIKTRLSSLENGGEDNIEVDDEVTPAMEKVKKARKESAKKVRIYREIDVTDPGRNPVETPKLGENPVGNVPGEGKYIGKEQYDDDMGKLNSRVERLEESVGLGRDDVAAGDENPEDMMKSERMRESLSKRKSIVGVQPRSNSIDVKGAVKEFLKTTGGVA